ncbi:MAG: site-specific DNA-methyltransferase, partial [Ignavibacteria bacterium]|nr:site-specific DNA-methyltransferase [Ignavibacteria bacterium]
MENNIINQTSLSFNNEQKIQLIEDFTPYYNTNFGSAYLADSLELIKKIPDESTDLVITSPPYALEFKKEYGNAEKKDYIDWFIPFAKEILRVIKENGSFVLNIGGSYNKGTPTKSLYHYKLLIQLVEEIGFHLAQEFFWYNPAKMPTPAEWVTVRRIRVKDSVEFIWWLSKSPYPKANNKNILKPYSKDMLRLNAKGIDKKIRPSGHNINPSFSNIDAGGSIPSNVFDNIENDNLLKFGNNAANDKYALGCKQNNIKMHPARYPETIPEFFIKFLTDQNDTILDPFAG